ncbi:MAG: hypothetical protein ACK5CA_14780 [Cyanobacteriota bacterium]
MNGVTLTASNFSTGNSLANANGLCFVGSGTSTTGVCRNLNSLTLSFSAPVQLISYQTGQNGFGTSANLTFSDGTNSSLQTSFVVGNTTNFSNQFSVPANQAINVTRSFSTTPPGGRALVLSQLTVDATPVPLESDALPVVGSAVFMAGGLWWKRKRAQAKGADFIAQK